jgi:hypothetical protein
MREKTRGIGSGGGVKTAPCQEKIFGVIPFHGRRTPLVARPDKDVGGTRPGVWFVRCPIRETLTSKVIGSGE